MNQAFFTALLTAINPKFMENLTKTFNGMSGDHKLAAYEWTSTMTNDNLENPTTQTTTLSGDLGIQYQLPLEIEDEYSFSQVLSLYLGGEQSFGFVSPWLSLQANLELYPVWVEILSNSFYFNAEDLTFCDLMEYGYEIGYVHLDVIVGFKECHAGVYDNVGAEVTETYVCDYNYQYLLDVIETTLGSSQYTPIFIDTCSHEETMEMEWAHENIDENVEEETEFV